MKTNSFVFAILLLATAACTKDELADGDRLPEGQYPLEIARITLGVEGGEAQPWGAPATRVSETVDGTGSVFDTGDPFTVQIIDDGTETATYTVQDDGTATSDAPLYWTNTTPNHTVTAWYPATDGTLDLGDQSQSLAYLLGATGTGDYQTPVKLTFTHQLTKVRVTPTDDALGEVQSLQLYTYTQCTYEKGTVVQGSQEGWIEMKKCEYTKNGNAITCWEANVVPGYTITKLRANGTEERELSSGITPVAGKFYNITLDKDKGYTDDGQGNYTVTSAEGLKAVADIANNGNLGINITLTENINLTDMDWAPIGIDYNHQYTGTFNGGGHTITGLTVTGSNEYAGLFGRIGSGGKVMNVKLEGVQIESDNEMSAVGGVVGYSYGNIENCSVSGSVSSNSTAGGVVGAQLSGSITGCSSSATVKGVTYAGGIAGYTNGGGSLTGCYATGSISVENNTTNAAWAGGIVGMNGTGTLIACYAAGNVSGNIVGGAVGVNYATVTACYWSGLPDNDNGGATKVDGTTVTWQNAVDAMNAALQNAGSEWRYELTGALPTLKK